MAHTLANPIPTPIGYTSFPPFRSAKRNLLRSIVNDFAARPLQQKQPRPSNPIILQTPYPQSEPRPCTSPIASTASVSSSNASKPMRSIVTWLWPFGRHPKRPALETSHSKTHSQPVTTRTSSTATDMEVTRQREQRARYFHRRYTPPASPGPGPSAPFEDLVQKLDAIALDEPDRKVVRRMERTWRYGDKLLALQNQEARVPADEARARSQSRRRGSQDRDLDSDEEAESYPQYDWLLAPEQRLILKEAQKGEAQRRALLDLADDLRLRGGGDSLPTSTPTVRRRRTTLPAPSSRFRPDDEARPSRRLWWLAGGRKGKVPTYGELRFRKEVEEVNRGVVGFWGTVMGRRGVGKVGMLSPEGEEKGEEGGEVEE